MLSAHDNKIVLSEYICKMLSSALFCLTIIMPAPSLGDIRLVNMTTDEIHIIGRDVDLFISMCLLVIDAGNGSLDEDKFKITVGLLLPGDQHALGKKADMRIAVTSYY